MNGSILRASGRVNGGRLTLASLLRTVCHPPSLRRLGRWAISLIAVLAAPSAFAQLSDIAVIKLGPDTAGAGTNITYRTTIVNAGPDASGTITISDPLAAGMTFISFTQTQGAAMACTTPAVNGTGSVDCTLPDLAFGASVQYDLTLHIDAMTPAGTVLMSGAVATMGPTQPYSLDDTEENSVGVAGTYILGAAVADVAISKTSAAAVAPNGNITYTITVNNVGPATATGVTFTDNLPSGTTFVSLQQTSGSTFTCTSPAVGANGTVSCSLASMSIGNAVFSLVVNSQAPSGTLIENQITVTSTSVDGNDENNASQASTRVEVSDLTLSMSAPATVARGSALSYVLTLGNAGPDAAQNVGFVESLPAGTTFASWAQNSGPTFACSYPAVGATGSVSCTAPFLLNGAAAQFTLTVTAATAGSATSSATAASDTPDLIPSGSFGAAASATTSVLAPPTIAMAFTPAVIAPGQSSTLTITLGNPAPNAVALSGVAIADALPPGLTVASASTTVCGGTLTTTAPGSINLSGATIAAGSMCAFSVTVTAPAAGIFVNTTGAASSSNGGNGGTATATLAAALPLLIAQTASPVSIQTGSTTTLTYVLTNPNSVTLTDLGLSDALPVGLRLAGNPGATNTCGGTLTAVAGGATVALAGVSLAAGASCTVSVVVQGVAIGTWYNTVAVTALSGGAGNTATAAVTVFANVPTIGVFAKLVLALLILAVGLASLRRWPLRGG